MAAPDLIEPVIGWRSWAAVALPERTSFGLHSPVWPETLWPPGEALKSQCKVSSHRRPHLSCRCGIYAFKEEPDLRDLAHQVTSPGYKYSSTIVVVGEVSLWGKVIEHERGFRAEYAYPRRLMPILPQPWPGPKDADPSWWVIHHELFSAYRVPVEFRCLDVSLRPPKWDPLAPPHGAG
ncbi:MAG: hypothetical protein ACR2NT_05600 [Acidimicrobiia bacterium]